MMYIPGAKLKNTAQIYVEIFFIRFFTVLVIRNVDISKAREDTPKRYIAILLYFEKPFKYISSKYPKLLHRHFNNE